MLIIFTPDFIDAFIVRVFLTRSNPGRFVFGFSATGRSPQQLLKFFIIQFQYNKGQIRLQQKSAERRSGGMNGEI
jgi:hypothetical protein